MLFTGERNIFGSTQVNAPSRFLDDIPSHLVESGSTKIAEFKNQSFAGSKQNEAKREKVFKDGERVRHETFGDGLIIASQGDVLTIAFSKAGLKKLSASIAPLKKI